MSYFEFLVAKTPRRLRPWVQNAKLRVRRGDSLVPEEELERVYMAALSRLRDRQQPLGDYLEFGVYTGSSLACMLRAARKVDVEIRLFGFDSFQGLPDEAAEEDDGKTWWPRQFAAARKLTERTLRANGAEPGDVVLVPGWFDETLTDATKEMHGLRKAAIVMIDCDLYSSAKIALEFCAPLIQDEAVFLFDDWNSSGLADRNEGERRAFEEFLAAHPDL